MRDKINAATQSQMIAMLEKLTWAAIMNQYLGMVE